MESYVEIDVFMQTLYMLISCMAAGYLSLKPLTLKQMSIYSIVISMMACCLWMQGSWLVLLAFEVLFFLLFFRWRWKTYLLTWTLRLLICFSLYAFLQGGFHNFQYFLPANASLTVLAVEVIVLWLLYRKWNYWIGKLEYVYTCRFEKIPLRSPMKGYLDTGNLMMLEDVPVVFLDHKFETYFKDSNIQCLVMNTMGGSVPIKCYEDVLHVEGLSQKRVFVHCSKHLNLPLQCQALLNMNLWLG